MALWAVHRHLVLARHIALPAANTNRMTALRAAYKRLAMPAVAAKVVYAAFTRCMAAR